MPPAPSSRSVRAGRPTRRLPSPSTVYCALFAEAAGGSTLRTGLLMAVNHSGDSDSTGSIAGNLLGAALGAEAIPPEWIDELEGAAVIR